MAAWHSLFKDRMVLLREVVTELDALGEYDLGGFLKDTRVTEEVRSELREALLNVAASASSPQKVDTRRLAAWCRENLDRVAGGLRLTRGA